MDYERIERPSSSSLQVGGFSPSKLRAMLLGHERRSKVDDDSDEAVALKVEESRFRLNPEAPAGGGEGCTDVEAATWFTECSTLIGGAAQSYRPRSDHATRLMGSVSFSPAAPFEFQRSPAAAAAERAVHRPAVVIVPPFSKPAPSKWDDAEKWISSPNSNRPSNAGCVSGRKPTIPVGNSLHGGTKAVAELVEDANAKRIDPHQGKAAAALRKPAANYALQDHFPATVAAAKPLVGSATELVEPPLVVKSVCSMRDMGTEMTPFTSQEPSRTATPDRSRSPVFSRDSSRSFAPGRAGTSPIIIQPDDSSCGEPEKELSDKDLQMETRKDIMILGTQLGKTKIATWASGEVERNDADASSLKIIPVDQRTRSALETRAAAWEDAEKAKYLSRFKREEIKIQAWENLQKVKADANMKKMEVDVENMRVRGHDRLMKKLAGVLRRAEEKRAAAELRRKQEATRTTRKAEHIRRTGHLPSAFSCFKFCP